jgi:hypothetical protein
MHRLLWQHCLALVAAAATGGKQGNFFWIAATDSVDWMTVAIKQVLQTSNVHSWCSLWF